MVIQRKKNGIFYIALISLVLILSCLLSCLNFTPYVASALAEGEEYSQVLEDLEKDENFDKSNYPENLAKLELQVIQIAESENSELFVYVYNPSANVKELIATSINISISKNEGLYLADDDEGKTYINYDLTLLNSDGVFYKYLVEDFTVSTDEIRYYNISNIYRAFDYLIDEPVEGNEISEVPNRVGKVFTAQTLNGETTYTCTEVETIEIVSKYVGFLRYYNGFKFYNESCDSHYVAFSTDKPIDKLIEAEVYFVSQEVLRTWVLGIENVAHAPATENYVALNYTETVSNDANGLFGNKYTWNRIEKASDFIANEDLTSEAEAQLKNKEWVLRFYETTYQDFISAGSNYQIYTEVSDVSILRLKFETDGEVFSLGVIDNKQTGDNTPDNVVEKPWWIWALLIGVSIIGLILLIALFPSVFGAIFKAIWQVIVWIAKGIWWIISAPFSVFKKDKK